MIRTSAELKKEFINLGWFRLSGGGGQVSRFVSLGQKQGKVTVGN